MTETVEGKVSSLNRISLEAAAGLPALCFGHSRSDVVLQGEFHDQKCLKIWRYHVSAICNAALRLV